MAVSMLLEMAKHVGRMRSKLLISKAEYADDLSRAARVVRLIGEFAKARHDRSSETTGRGPICFSVQ